MSGSLSLAWYCNTRTARTASDQIRSDQIRKERKNEDKEKKVGRAMKLAKTSGEHDTREDGRIVTDFAAMLTAPFNALQLVRGP